MITCSFKIKKDYIPTIQIKHSMNFKQNEYLETSNGEIVCLVLTNVDLNLFFEHYEVEELEFICGWKFKSLKGIFNTYIDKWITRKNEGTISRK